MRARVPMWPRPDPDAQARPAAGRPRSAHGNGARGVGSGECGMHRGRGECSRPHGRQARGHDGDEARVGRSPVPADCGWVGGGGGGGPAGRSPVRAVGGCGCVGAARGAGGSAGRSSGPEVVAGWATGRRGWQGLATPSSAWPRVIEVARERQRRQGSGWAVTGPGGRGLRLRRGGEGRGGPAGRSSVLAVGGCDGSEGVRGLVALSSAPGPGWSRWRRGGEGRGVGLGGPPFRWLRPGGKARQARGRPGRSRLSGLVARQGVANRYIVGPRPLALGCIAPFALSFDCHAQILEAAGHPRRPHGETISGLQGVLCPLCRFSTATSVG
ncbi:hypothetical protein HNR12_001189 [Streptomonospora nanhaiensis]|uniref:Uncharacterized protein n=1 Tax=Streptomonospora nanhaiensis TaxID=1323731 RepID=A0A853BK44_9ACTN|nr:hypothetical protein [Streptomonospora nanhaiensis]